MPAKAARALRRLLHPLDWAALFLTAPGLACDVPGGTERAHGGAGVGVRGPSPREFCSCSNRNAAP